MDASGMTSEASPEMPALDPQQFAELAQAATDEQLKAGLAMNRELILNEIFRQMPEQLDPERAAGVEATVEWRILKDQDRGHDSWQLIIRDGHCEVQPGPATDPTVTLEIGPVDFIRLITGSASGPKLFLFGRLKVRGNLMLGARMPSLFHIPGT
jgi:putative sterol carrier protein